MGKSHLAAGLAVRQTVVAEVAGFESLAFELLRHLAQLGHARVVVAGVDDFPASLNRQESSTCFAELAPIHCFPPLAWIATYKNTRYMEKVNIHIPRVKNQKQPIQ